MVDSQLCKLLCSLKSNCDASRLPYTVLERSWSDWSSSVSQSPQIDRFRVKLSVWSAVPAAADKRPRIQQVEVSSQSSGSETGLARPRFPCHYLTLPYFCIQWGRKEDTYSQESSRGESLLYRSTRTHRPLHSYVLRAQDSSCKQRKPIPSFSTLYRAPRIFPFNNTS